MVSQKTNQEQAPVLVVCGPTGVGKTAFALAAAEALDAEILSIDSLQVYRGLDIGTAKATVEERARVPHHLIDILEADQEFNVADFMAASDAAVAEIRSRGKNVVAVGGTNLYVRVFSHGIFEAPAPDAAIRERHKAFAAEHGVAALHAQLAQIDPDLATRLGENDLVRVSRGLEIFEQTGRRLSDLQEEHRFATPRHRVLKVGLNRGREELYRRIDDRVDLMFAQGFEEEYDRLTSRFDRGLKPLMSLGYRHLGLHRFDGMGFDEMVTLFKRDTRRFAKQQVSWLRSEEGLRWALAPQVVDGRIPAPVLEDLRRFYDGGVPELAWTQVGSEF